MFVGRTGPVTHAAVTWSRQLPSDYQLRLSIQLWRRGRQRGFPPRRFHSSRLPPPPFPRGTQPRPETRNLAAFPRLFGASRRRLHKALAHKQLRLQQLGVMHWICQSPHRAPEPCAEPCLAVSCLRVLVTGAQAP
ncbi:hypothetical protein MTO96_009951 [Rhipicephalus appendiculatus]